MYKMEEKQKTYQFFKKNNIETIKKLLASKTRLELEKEFATSSQKITSEKQSRAFKKEVYEIAQEKDECDLFGINYTRILDYGSLDHLKVQVAALYRLNIVQINPQ